MSKAREEPALIIFALTLVVLAGVLAYGFATQSTPDPPKVTTAPDVSLLSPTTVYDAPAPVQASPAPEPSTVEPDALPATDWRWYNYRTGEIAISIPRFIYPVDGVVFHVNGRRDRTDYRGTLEDDVFHATSRTIRPGDVYTAAWTDSTGAEHNATYIIEGEQPS